MVVWFASDNRPRPVQLLYKYNVSHRVVHHHPAQPHRLMSALHDGRAMPKWATNHKAQWRAIIAGFYEQPSNVL